jgi:Protein of unknown function (DUF2971)
MLGLYLKPNTWSNATMTVYVPPAFAQHFEMAPPDVLHHYTGQAGLLGIVNRAEMWCTKVQFMNDATEFGLALNMARAKLSHLLGEIPDGPATAARKRACFEFRRSLDGLEDINLFAACFCEDGDILSQWRGYGGGSQGYAIGFTSNALTKSGADHGFTLGKCIYDTDLQNTIVEQAIESCLYEETAIPWRGSWGFHGPLADILFRCGAFFKEPSFAEENEWRLVSSAIMFHDSQLEVRAGRSMPTPYFRLPIGGDDAPSILHVVVGPCPHMVLSKSAVTTLLLRKGVRGPLEGRQVAIGSTIPFRDW